MAINIWTPFRADQYVAEGGAALGAGIGGGLANLGDALAKALEKKKQRNQAAKASAAFFKSSPDLQQYLGISPEDYEGLSADDKIDATTSGIASLKLHSELAQAKEQGKVRQAQLAEFLAKQNERQSMTDIAGQLSQQGQAPEDVPAPLNNAEFTRRTAPPPPDLMSAIARLGPGRGIEPRAAADLADSLARMRSASAPSEDVNFVEDPETGERFATFGKSMASSGTNPKKARAKPTAPIQPRVVVSRDVMTQMPIISWSGSPEDFKKQFPNAKLPVEAEETITEAAKPLAMPKTKGELKKDQLYETPRGVAKWDGTKFVRE